MDSLQAESEELVAQGWGKNYLNKRGPNASGPGFPTLTADAEVVCHRMNPAFNSEVWAEKQGGTMKLRTVDGKLTELVPYRRGLSLREVVKGTLTRFLPGSVIGMGVLSAIIPPAGLDLPVLLELLLLHEVGPLAIGFGLGLLGLHRWLYPDSEVTGRKSFIAGLLTPIAMLGAGTLTGLLGMISQLQPALVSFLVGIVMASAMHFPWLSPTAAEKRSDRYEPDQLPEGSREAT